ncbi:MAG: NAD(P)-dependent oxidoreductase [Steroidobacteraceae bacterium]
MTESKRVLVTGAGGFIGRSSIAPLERLGFEVHAVLSGATPEEHGPPALQGVVRHVVDLLKESQVDALLAQVTPSHLLHFAWIATPGIYWHSADNYRWLASSRYLLRGFRERGGIRAVMAGSCVEYDWSKAGVCSEISSPMADESGPLTPYAATKIALQKALAEFSREEHLSSAWGRIFFQFGPYEHPDRLVPSVIRHLLRNKEALCSHGRQIRSFLHVADVGAAFAQLLAGDIQGPVNIGSDERIALADLIGRIAREVGRPDLVRLGARSTQSDEPPLLVPDVRRLRDEVQWRPRLSLNEGISDAVAWWRGQGVAGAA